MAVSKLYTLTDSDGKVVFENVQPVHIAKYLDTTVKYVTSSATTRGHIRGHIIKITGIDGKDSYANVKTDEWKKEWSAAWDAERLAARERLGWIERSKT